MLKKIWRKLMSREVISYLIFGVLTTLVNWVFYGSMVKTGIDYRIATAAAWVVSVLFAYVVNKIFVFQSYNMHLGYLIKEVISFTACRVVSGVMELVLMVIMVSWLNMGEYVSKVLVSVVVVVANYVFSKLFIFRKSEEKPL
ncbi:GtrA family protein [Lacrimispora algidixylanolytica]|uniref:Sugar translocase n=1 Tax=Lacrimispora algidixylanolytica TaxID=94868 RepID=A0A419T411_9FIRM|nr:GtrA family protein [Lacrimispora algidixylanolytica]RKD32185.1 sugar translocase [Lacrimispora algidixylanolytica]